MKKLPERYIKIWQYMTDSNQPINESRIAGMLEEIFIARISETKDMLKSNIKTMKVKGAFDLRNDGWMQALVQKWEHTFMPDLHDAVKEIKAIPDIKDRAPRMRSFISELSTGTSPMNVLSIMEDDYRNDRESLHEPLEEVPEESETEPGYIRRVGRYAGSTLKAGAAGLGYAMMRERGIIGGIARGAAAVYGLHRTAKAFASRSTSAKTTQTRRSGALSNVFGRTKSTVAPKTTDFTPREEQLEGGGVTDILKRIEENTAALLKKFGGTPKGQGGEGGGILGLFKGLMGSVGSFITSLLTGPAMMAAIAVLGAALAVAFGKKAVDMLCEKFPMLCDQNAIFNKMGKAVLPSVEKFAGDVNEMTGRNLDVERRRAKNMSVEPLEERAAKVHDKLAAMEFGDGLGPKKKFTPEQVAGIMTSLKGESSTFDPRDVNSIGATGIAQWHGERKDALFEFAKKKGQSPYDLETQLDFLEKEGNTTHKRVIDKILKAKTPEEASRLWTELYEVPFHPKTQAKELEAEQQRRLTESSSVYAQVLQRQETKHVALTSKGLEYKYEEPKEVTSKAFIPKKSITMVDTVKDLDMKIVSEKDPVKRAQLVQVRDQLVRQHSTEVQATPKTATPRASTITPKTVENGDQASQTQINVLPNAQPTQGANTSGARPGHYNKDDSIAKIVIDRQSLSFS